jgi:hypothetical protein
VTVPINGKESTYYLDHAQKIFEIGEKGTLAVVCWGMGGISDMSYQTMAAELEDELADKPDYTVERAVGWWKDIFWGLYDLLLGRLRLRAGG